MYQIRSHNLKDVRCVPDYLYLSIVDVETTTVVMLWLLGLLSADDLSRKMRETHLACEGTGISPGWW